MNASDYQAQSDICELVDLLMKMQYQNIYGLQVMIP